ncbi:MAG TPA: hypothetical protein VIY69_09280 [Candidatus Acidoferrales bacterium]
MTTEDFVQAVKIQTSDAAVNGTIKVLIRPPDRKPREKDVRLSDWYGRLSEQDREMLALAVREAAELVVFEFFCVLDGVVAIEDSSDKGALQLDFVKGDERTRLNDTTQIPLHDQYNVACKKGDVCSSSPSSLEPFTVGENSALKAKQTSVDECDIHDVSSVGYVGPHYDRNAAPSILLPKAEHRKL